MMLSFTPNGGKDYQHWLAQDARILKRVNSLIMECLRTPREGIGKPEPLKYSAAEDWSRRITEEHRLVYRIEDDEITVLAARFHYDK
ncbi:MAG: Txe/YoeB family addiction module toxin [Propionibacteriaceae bacterium]|jgi:toxin YoeB|nr:Txe/YoeB family addiction module toxin [Propionibacteriaceae bacterium]